MFKRYTAQFWLLCISSLLFFASFNMIIPELPGYLSSLGGAQYKGLIISLFTATALLSRPFSGKLADRIGRVPVMIFGASVCVICSMLYPVLSSVAGFLLLRLVHGFSTGFTPTGLTAYLSDIVPVERRGEAMGLLSSMGTIGLAIGPAIGGVVANYTSLNTMFYFSSATAIASILLMIGTKETLKDKNRFSIRLLAVERTDLFEPNVIIPSFIMVLSSFSFGTLMTVLPDFSTYVGINNKGLLFTYFTIPTLIMRMVSGRLSDVYGRRFILRFSTLLLVVGATTAAFSETSLQLTIGVILHGCAHGMTSPTLFAWTADLSHRNHRGRGLASLYMAMEFGIGIGALLSGWIFANEFANLRIVFLTCGTLGATALLFLLSPFSVTKVAPES